MSTLTATIQNLSLGDPSFLTFNPIGENVWIRANFEHIPRYLIQIFTPQSAGSTDEFWAKSRDARYGNEFTAVDIFMRDNDHVANMLNTHLRWKGKNGEPDNLTSWTSLWLFALQYIFHLHKNVRDASSFDAIKCCIIDTTLFPKGCFVRDTDLIRAYEQSNSDLHSFSNLRSRRHKTYTGSFYFGEYLSQGALKIREKCKIVSAKDMIDRGLFILQPLLQEFENWEMMERPPWANEVIRLREAFYNEELEIEQATDAQIQASIDIAELFGPRFRLPMAAGLIGLLPRRANDAAMQKAFRSIPFTDTERRECSHFENLPDDRLLPEVNQFQHIMRGIYKDHCMQELVGHVSSIEALLRDIVHAERSPQPRGYQGLGNVLNRVAIIASLTESLAQDVLGGNT